jgi:hypothetical protein
MLGIKYTWAVVDAPLTLRGVISLKPLVERTESRDLAACKRRMGII